MRTPGELEPWLHLVALALTAVGAVTDWRKGEIPNWVTLPAIVVAPLVYGLVGGVSAALFSLVGLLVCSVVPLLLFWRNGMAGGDVKLFAALGAVGGVYLGLEAQFLSVVIASVYALGNLVWSGRILGALGSTLFVGLNPVLPRRWRRPISNDLLHSIRLGAAILLGTTIALAGHHPELLRPDLLG
ncbi:MAG: A24 family peptidase [Sandaracinaceae bacterium]|nr:A24 family peptidase [Sandaracinaceae bacterium]